MGEYGEHKEQKVNKAAINKSGAMDALGVLRSVFGYDQFRGQQAEIIDHVIAGHSCCVLMPTGSGKSLCYQIPALCRPGVGVVVSPLIALMEDQVAALRELGVRAAAIHSGLGSDKTAETFRALRNNALDLIYVAPERLLMDDFLDVLDGIDLALFAIDEAHCISQWGHDFRPEYQQLSILCTRYPHVPRMAVTATADTPTRHEMVARLKLGKLYMAGFDRPNIQYHVGAKHNTNKQFLDFLGTRAGDESGIVYCLSRRKVDEIASFLTEHGYKALPYHAGLEASVRAKNQDRFLKEEGVIMVATIAFGMGLNKPDVRFVVHLDLPKTIEAYYQETGRAGRDGLPATAWMIYGMQDVALRRQMIEGSDSPDHQKRLEVQKLGALLGYCEAITCRRRILLNYFGDVSNDCGNCDTCLQPPRTFDGTVAVQKVLSCVYRTDQRFGAHYIIDVLMGADDKRIRDMGHDALSVFGIGTEYAKREWQAVIRQMLAHDILYADAEAYGGLIITPRGQAFLKDKETIQLRVDERPRTKKTRDAAAAAGVVLDNDADQALFQKLRALRMTAARAQNLPPYVVFHDRTLMDMAAQKPGTLEALGHINGVGQSKLEKYGQMFLAVINDHVVSV